MVLTVNLRHRAYGLKGQTFTWNVSCKRETFVLRIVESFRLRFKIAQVVKLGEAETTCFSNAEV